MSNVYDETGFKSKTREILKEGQYDAVLHGVINLGLKEGMEQTYKDEETGEAVTKKPEPAVMYRFVFELPNDLRANDDQPHVIHKDVKLSDWIPKKKGQLESGFHKLLKALGEDPTRTTICDYMTMSALSKLAGKAVTLEVVEKTSQSGNSYNRVSNVIRLHPKVTPPTPVREFFYFNPRNPDLNVFKSTLTYWTQKEIMEALDSSNFPETLHKEWVGIEEARSADTADTNTYNTAAIE